MIDFIICEDEKKYNKKLEKTVDTFMMKNRFQYCKHIFYDYDDEFLKVITEPMGFKIYILDIETPTRSGIDVARRIRDNDIESIIIFVTGHDELGDIILKNDLLFLSFINKFDDCENRLNHALEIALKHMDTKQNLRFTERGIVYTITLHDILYITRDSVERKSIIKTTYTEFKAGKSLHEIEKMLNDDFQYTHRACIVNKKRVASIDKSNKVIVFDNGTKTDLVSNRLCKNF